MPTLSLSNPTPVGSANAPTLPNVTTDNWNLPTAYMNQWSFGVERELWRNSGLGLEYLGSHSLHLDRNYYNNTPLPDLDWSARGVPILYSARFAPFKTTRSPTTRG